MDKSKINILLVDDDPDLKLTTALYLREIGYRAGFASNGKEALEWISKNGDPDVILLDLHMPVMDGITFMSEYVGTAPIVITSAFEHAAKFVDGDKAISVCTKPYKLGSLEEHIEHAIEVSGGPKWKRLLPCKHTCFTMDVRDSTLYLECLIPGCGKCNAVHTDKLDFRTVLELTVSVTQDVLERGDKANLS